MACYGLDLFLHTTFIYNTQCVLSSMYNFEFVFMLHNIVLIMEEVNPAYTVISISCRVR